MTRKLLTNTTAVLVLVSSIFTVNCNKEEQKLNISKPVENNFSINEAKNWFLANSTKKQIISVAARTGLSSKIKSFTPQWSKALNFEDENYYVVECPVQFEKSPGFLVTDGINSNNKINGLTRLLILKNKETGNITTALMNVYSFDGKIDEGVNYSIQSDRFNGNIFFTDLNGELINGWIYEDGKVIKKSKKMETNAGARLAPISEGGTSNCQTVETFWYERTCYYYSDGSEQCTDWIFVGTTSTIYCPTNGSGGYEYQNECLNECINSFNNLSQVTVTAENEGSDIININGIRKYKNPKWKILSNITWTLHSQEQGIVELVDVQTNKWVWQELIHPANAITKKGFTPGGIVTWTNGNGTPTFTPGTPNVLYGGMSLNFDVTYQPVCDCPGIQNIIPPFTQPYTSNGMWDAKPQN